MADKVEATYHGETPIEKALRLRKAYAAAVDSALSTNDPNGSDTVAPAVTAWLDAEDALTPSEYNVYQEKWRESQA